MTANQTYEEETASFLKTLDEKLLPERTSRRTTMEDYTETPVVSIEPETGLWRSRPVRYSKRGVWSAIRPVFPQFDLRPFAAGENEPPNPYYRTVLRKPKSHAERPMPVAVVSPSYSLVPHLDAAKLCRSVDGRSRLCILFGWLRLVCSNGLVIGKTMLEIQERHGRNLDLEAISHHLGAALSFVDEDKDLMAAWQDTPVRIQDIAAWSNGTCPSRKDGESKPPLACIASVRAARTSN